MDKLKIYSVIIQYSFTFEFIRKKMFWPDRPTTWPEGPSTWPERPEKKNKISKKKKKKPRSGRNFAWPERPDKKKAGRNVRYSHIS